MKDEDKFARVVGQVLAAAVMGTAVAVFIVLMLALAVNLAEAL